MSCAHSAPHRDAFGTYNGMKVYNHTNHDIPSSMVDAVVGMTLQYLDGYDKDVRDYTIRFYNKLFALQFPDNTIVYADGVTDVVSKTIYISSFTPCVPASSLSHELGHLIKFNVSKTGDKDHEDKEYWHKIKDLEAVLQQAMCSDEEVAREQFNRQPPQ